jgi:Alginate lyase
MRRLPLFHSLRLVRVTAMVSLYLAVVGTPQSLLAADILPPPSAAITMDINYLALSKARLSAGDTQLKPAYDKLIQDANAVMALAPESVTRKKLMPPSGIANDYMSLAPYWWPDTSQPTGLPYIQRDGQFNPSARNSDTDSQRLQIMCLSAQTLSLAYYFSGHASYAKKTADVLRTWFIDPALRMNPHLRYGQAIRGVVDGRGIGLIDTRNLRMAIDAALLIKDSGQWSPQDMASLQLWFKEFTQWMLTSDIGLQEYNQFNNHGMFYDMQIANYALFFGDVSLACRSACF